MKNFTYIALIILLTTNSISRTAIVFTSITITSITYNFNIITIVITTSMCDDNYYDFYYNEYHEYYC